jgi:hypothetical protein
MMSPIDGISEVIMLPLLGKIRLGIKNDAEKTTCPTLIDYFICPEEVKRVFGEKPRKLQIMFPTNDPEQWASQYLRCYSESRRLICRGNGKTAVARVNNRANDYELREKQCIPLNCSAYLQEFCRPVMNLQFLIPKCPGLGVYQLDTSSSHSMVQINSSLKRIFDICSRFAMIPLTLQFIEKEVQSEAQIKIARVLNLLPTYPLTEPQWYSRKPTEQALILPPSDSEAPDDLFPWEVLKKNNKSQRTQEEEELIELWDQAKRQVWQAEIRDYQIAHYFMEHFHFDAGLTDFNSTLPPAKFNIENLTGFLKDIEIHMRFS